jgi:replicative DNA helicase
LKIDELNDIQAEAGVISTLVYHPEFILNSEFLKPKHFYKIENGCIYWGIGELYKDGIDKIDSENLINILNSNSRVKKEISKFNVNSINDFIDLAKPVARSTIEEYLIIAKQVTSIAFKRTLYKKLCTFQNDCFNDKYDLESLNTHIYDDLNKISEEFVVDDKVQLFGEKINDIWNHIKESRNSNGFYGIPSKFPLLNKYCPYERGELIVITGQRKQGKSIFMLNECVHKIKNKVPTVYFDTELTDERFTERILGNLSGVPIYKIKAGSYTTSEEILIKDALNFLEKAPLVHIYDPMLNNNKIYSICKILQYKIGLSFVIYDYLKSSELDSSSQYNDLGNKTNFLKNNIAGGLGLSVLAGAQLSRKNEIGDSYKIEQYLSSELIMEKKTPDEIAKDGEECGDRKLIVKLNRNGSSMDEECGEYIDIVFSGNTASIEQCKKQHTQENLPI